MFFLFLPFLFLLFVKNYTWFKTNISRLLQSKDKVAAGQLRTINDEGFQWMDKSFQNDISGIYILRWFGFLFKTCVF